MEADEQRYPVDLDRIWTFVSTLPEDQLARRALKALRLASLREAMSAGQDAWELYTAAYCAVRLAEKIGAMTD